MVHGASDQLSAIASKQRDQQSTVVHGATDQLSAIANILPVVQEQELRPSKSSPKKVFCPKCNVSIYLKNLQRHIKRKHGTENVDICADYHLASQCVDASNGIFAVAQNFRGPPVPIHVKQKLRGPSECEVDDCSLFYDVAARSGHQAFRCFHLRSLDYCSTPSNTCHLEEDTLTELVKQRWFTENKKEMCLARLKEATKQSAPLAVGVQIGPPRKHYVSVLENKPSYYS